MSGAGSAYSIIDGIVSSTFGRRYPLPLGIVSAVFIERDERTDVDNPYLRNVLLLYLGTVKTQRAVADAVL
jgi:hypothetical protein